MTDAHGLTRLEPALALIGRLLLAYIFITSGWSKIATYAATSQTMEAQGVPSALLPLVICVEIGGGLAVAFGLLSRLAGLGMAAFAIATAVLFHLVPSDQAQMINFNKNLAIAGGFLLLAAFGPGAWSIDACWRHARSRARPTPAQEK